MNKLIGRQDEINSMQQLLKSNEAEMLAVIGRRRVGKTFLIQNAFKKHLFFEITGIQNASKKEQLFNFTRQFTLSSKKPISLPNISSWYEAFIHLETYLESSKSSRKRVLFFDELPWLASPKSEFLEALSHFWNNWANTQNILVVICGSAASWMIDKVIHNKGGLHNRVTKLIRLQPFSLYETELYLKSRKVKLSRYQIAQIYMVMGGIPHYLKEIEIGLSAAQNIDKICFKKDGLLKDEFIKLYPALFSNATKHTTIIKVLAKKWKGFSREEILATSKLSDGGTFTKVLEELENSGFITSYFPFGKKKKDKLFRLTDEYSLFYLRFIDNNRNTSWLNISQSQIWKSWSGFAFESLCLKHSNAIKKAIGIEKIYSEESSFIFKASIEELGFQIDLVIDRNDQIINICEMKFYASEFTIDKSYSRKLRHKLAGFKEQTKTKKQLFLTMVSTYGINENEHKIDLVQNDITLDALFE